MITVNAIDVKLTKDAEFEAIANAIITKNAKIKQLQAEVDALKGQVKSYMKENNVESSAFGKRMCWIMHTTSTKFDATTFASDHPRLYKKYSFPVDSTRLYVK